MSPQSTDDVPVEGRPVLQQYSKEQLVSRAKEYMVITFGPPRQILDPAERDRWYERLGMLTLYIDHIWKSFS